jgi:hypothetical protein
MITYTIETVTTYFLNVSIANKLVSVPYYNDTKHPPTDSEIIECLANYFPQITIFSNPDEIVIYEEDLNGVSLGSVAKIPYCNKYSEIHESFKPSDHCGGLGGNVIIDKEIIKKVLEYILR